MHGTKVLFRCFARLVRPAGDLVLTRFAFAHLTLVENVCVYQLCFLGIPERAEA